MFRFLALLFPCSTPTRVCSLCGAEFSKECGIYIRAVTAGTAPKPAAAEKVDWQSDCGHDAGVDTMRHVLVILTLMMPGITAWSQTPKQFNGLLTTSIDYTCAGTVPCATWPMPPIPAPGESWLDPTFGTTTWRLAVPPANTSGKVIPAYNRVQAWNSNNTLMFMTDLGNAGLDLYDATTTPPTPINRITTDLGAGIYPDAGDGDALWAFTDPHRIYFQARAGAAYGLSLMYVDVSACTPSNCVLHPTIVHTFSCTTDAVSNPELGAGVAGNKIETGSGAQGGMFDNTDTYFSFTCDKLDGKGRHRD